MPYENTENDWKFLEEASQRARYLGLIPIENIVDRKNPTPHIKAKYEDPSCWIDTPDIDDPTIYVDGITGANSQPYHLEVWIEKSTMDDILIPVCEDYYANLQTFEGEASLTRCNDLVKRIEESGGKPTRIFYISDFDPAGRSMPVATARKLEWLAKDLPYEIKLKSIALTLDQVITYKLPRIPIKEKEKRAGKFEEAFGSGAVELDALEAIYPGELAKILRNEMSKYFSVEAAEEAAEEEKRLQIDINKKIEDIKSGFSPNVLGEVQRLMNEIDDIDTDVSDYEVEPFEPNVEEDDEEWLFDSNREYLEQLTYYQKHKRGTHEK